MSAITTNASQVRMKEWWSSFVVVWALRGHQGAYQPMLVNFTRLALLAGTVAIGTRTWEFVMLGKLWPVGSVGFSYSYGHRRMVGTCGLYCLRFSYAKNLASLLYRYLVAISVNKCHNKSV